VPHSEFAGTSDAGPYGDVVREIDAIVGRLLDHLKARSLERDTIVIFTSDNGPWFEGSSAPLRDRKGGAGYDGGYRVPFIAWAPGRIAAGGRTNAICCGIDLLPTLCALAGVRLPADVEIDGLDISGVLLRGERSPHEEIVLFDNEEVVGVRTQRWKYVARSHYRSFRLPMERAGYPQLYEVGRDVGESYSVAARHPGVLEDMRARFARAEATFAPFKLGVPAVFRALTGVRESRGRRD
jgi:arylsulfatase A-like enzyme